MKASAKYARSQVIRYAKLNDFRVSVREDIWDRCYHCAQEAHKKSLSDFLSLLRKPVAGLGQKSHVLLSLLKQEHLEKKSLKG